MRLGFLDFALCHLRIVGAHAHHVDVGVGHLEAVIGVQRPSDFRKLLAENLFRHPTVVAAGDRHPYVGGRLCKLQFPHKLHHEMWRLPGINREYETHPLAFRKSVFETVFALGFGDENERLVNRLRDAFCYKTAVAATGEIKNHSSKFCGKNTFFDGLHAYMLRSLEVKVNVKVKNNMFFCLL